MDEIIYPIRPTLSDKVAEHRVAVIRGIACVVLLVIVAIYGYLRVRAMSPNSTNVVLNGIGRALVEGENEVDVGVPSVLKITFNQDEELRRPVELRVEGLDPDYAMVFGQ